MKRVSYRQSGFVSIFTVLFFVIFITVITVGFLRIIVQEQRQSIDNSLTASALAAAQAGIEDGKRAILLYNDPSTGGDAALMGAFNYAFSIAGQADCKSIYGSAIGQRLGLDGSGKIADSTNLNQRYSCLTILPETPDYVGQALKDRSTIVPLKGMSSFDQIQFYWHDTTNTKDGPLGGIAPSPLLPTQTAWAAGKYAAYIRLELITVPTPGAITPGSVTNQVIYVVPGAISGTANFAGPQPNITIASCVTGSAQQYACKVSVDANGTNTEQQYLRVTPVYTTSYFKVTMSSGGTPVNFNAVEPIIDATGTAADVFRRLQARVTLSSNILLPEYALESGSDICKSFAVTNKDINFSNSGGICTQAKY